VGAVTIVVVYFDVTVVVLGVSDIVVVRVSKDTITTVTVVGAVAPTVTVIGGGSPGDNIVKVVAPDKTVANPDCVAELDEIVLQVLDVHRVDSQGLCEGGEDACGVVMN